MNNMGAVINPLLDKLTIWGVMSSAPKLRTSALAAILYTFVIQAIPTLLLMSFQCSWLLAVKHSSTLGKKLGAL